MMTPIPPMNPATMGSERKSASQPSFEQSDRHDDDAGDDRGRGDERHVLGATAGSARRSSATAKSGAIVESAPTETIGFEPRTKKTSVAAMKAIIAVKAGHPGQLRGGELLGDGDREQRDAGEDLTRGSSSR